MTLTINASPNPIQVDKNTIYRDVMFYIVSTLATLIIAITDEIDWYEAVLFLFIYIAMVVVVYV